METKFLELVKEVMDIEDKQLDLSVNFRELDEWDSLANLSLVAMLDDEFGIVIDSQKFKKMNTLQEVFDEIERGL